MPDSVGPAGTAMTALVGRRERLDELPTKSILSESLASESPRSPDSDTLIWRSAGHQA